MYMPKKKAKATRVANQEALRWRVTEMGAWREYRGFTQQAAADAIVERYGLAITRESLGRYEQGKQMPLTEMIEAVADLYKTDIHSLLNRKPGEPGRNIRTAADLVGIWDEADERGRNFIAEAAERVRPSGQSQ